MQLWLSGHHCHTLRYIDFGIRTDRSFLNTYWDSNIWAQILLQALLCYCTFILMLSLIISVYSHLGKTAVDPVYHFQHVWFCSLVLLSQSRNIGISVTTGSKILYHCKRKFLCICSFRRSMANMKTKWQPRSQLIFIHFQFWDSLECFYRHGNVSVGRSHLIMGLWRCLFEI